LNETFFTVINPVAGHGRCRREAGAALDGLRSAGVRLEVVETQHAGHGSALVREAYRNGFRRFLGVGGDGISYEIVNGLFPGAEAGERPTLAVLPLGTGNSFLRDFTTEREAEYATRAIGEGRSRPCDVLRLKHRDGIIHYINLLSVGFAADAAAVTNRKYKRWGHLGYLLGVFTCLVKLDRRPFPHRLDSEPEWDRRPCLFLTFNNSKFTGRTMMIAPNADTSDGLIEYVRWGPIGRIGLIANLRTLYDGSHVRHPLASRRAIRRVDFALDGPVDVMVDGEVLTLHCETLDVLPSALQVMV
jgi:YegS/Rv2252/BmrU family lipid kinase